MTLRLKIGNNLKIIQFFKIELNCFYLLIRDILKNNVFLFVFIFQQNNIYVNKTFKYVAFRSKGKVKNGHKYFNFFLQPSRSQKSNIIKIIKLNRSSKIIFQIKIFLKIVNKLFKKSLSYTIF